MTNASFTKGDLVRFRSKKPESCGIVVDVHKTNSGESAHVRNVSNSYSHVYYILVNDSGIDGPYFYDELSRIT